MAKRPGGTGRSRVTAGQVVTASVSHPADTTAVTRYLLALVGRCADRPMIDELAESDLGTPRATAAIAAAALCWLRHKGDDTIRADLERELAENDWLVRYRVREAGLDVHGRGATDWLRIYDVLQARREYRERWGVPS